jgi:hypothetical protein
MSTPADPIQTFAAQEQANLTAIGLALTNIAAGVNGLDTLIQQLQAQIAAGASTLTAADQTLLNNIVASSSGLVTQANAAAAATAPPAAPTS